MTHTERQAEADRVMLMSARSAAKDADELVTWLQDYGSNCGMSWRLPTAIEEHRRAEDRLASLLKTTRIYRDDSDNQ